MRLRMLWYQFRMLTIRDGVKRTAYLKKRNVYAVSYTHLRAHET